jgi:hypothetical protein
MFETALMWGLVAAALGLLGYLIAFGWRGLRWALVCACVSFALVFFVALWWMSQGVVYDKPGLRP